MTRTGLAGVIAVLGLLGAIALSPCTATAEGTAAKAKTAKPLPEPADAAVRERERQALIVVYQALGGPDWIERDFWGSEPAGRRVAWRGDRLGRTRRPADDLRQQPDRDAVARDLPAATAAYAAPFLQQDLGRAAA